MYFAGLLYDGNTIHLFCGGDEMLDKRNLGKVIKNRRKELMLTQNQVSEVTGLSRNYISDIENGRYSPSIDSLSRIAIYLNLDLNVLKMTDIQVSTEESIK